MSKNPDLPTAISLINGRYFLFSADVVSYLRREHRICGVLIGSIPQSPQQNIFLGLPLELMPEEAQLLVDKGIAHIVDDVKAHAESLRNLDRVTRHEYLKGLRSEGEQAAKVQAGLKERKRKKALKKLGLTPSSEAAEAETPRASDSHTNIQHPSAHPETASELTDESLFTPPPTETAPQNISIKPVATAPLAVTPATTDFLTLPPSPPQTPPAAAAAAAVSPPPQVPLRNLPTSYPLFAHLHARKYFLSPGLRFGCQYLVYPGDPLRFHSHFLAVGVAWDQEIDLMDLVGGGRLGTGVKKAFLIGGLESAKPTKGMGVGMRKGKETMRELEHDHDHDHDHQHEQRVRTFSLEWAGM